ADDEPTPEVISIAADRAQAGRCLEAAKRMVRAEPMLESRTEVYQHRVIVPSTAGVYKVMSSEAPSAHGLNTSACIADEVHAMENRRELWEAIETSVGARRQPMLVTITTAGTLRESLEFEMFDYAMKVRDRVIDNPYFLPVVYSAGDGDDWTSPETWRKCAPSLGHTVHEGYYAEKCKEAQEQPSMETPFRTYYLCQHVSASNRWLRMADWDKCRLDFDESRLAGLPCYLGIDLERPDRPHGRMARQGRGVGALVGVRARGRRAAAAEAGQSALPRLEPAGAHEAHAGGCDRLRVRAA
ncbi:MAG: hypothetical protein EBR73_14470, partial [Rhodobacteraceae bacterium]|nr:hypothetical protein [Paracoccaceae bacterium]